MTDEPKKLKLVVVAENTQQQIDTSFAQEDLDYALRQLAANIIRVVRGAGNPDEIIVQCAKVVDTAIAFREAAERVPSPVSVASAIKLKHDSLQYDDSFWFSRQLADRKMISGVLQFAASRLLGQLTQERRGETEMHEAYRDMESAYEELRKKRAAEARAARPRQASKKKPAKRKPG